jgi:hypothetical protein
MLTCEEHRGVPVSHMPIMFRVVLAWSFDHPRSVMTGADYSPCSVLLLARSRAFPS